MSAPSSRGPLPRGHPVHSPTANAHLTPRARRCPPAAPISPSLYLLVLHLHSPAPRAPLSWRGTPAANSASGRPPVRGPYPAPGLPQYFLRCPPPAPALLRPLLLPSTMAAARPTSPLCTSWSMLSSPPLIVALSPTAAAAMPYI